jgi:hypothetical protein
MPRKARAAKATPQIHSGATVVRVPLTFRRIGGRKQILPPDIAAARSVENTAANDALVRALAKAHRWRRQIEDGHYTSIAELARAKQINESFACRVLRLTLLSPRLVEQIMIGKYSNQLHLSSVLARWPTIWIDQQLHPEPINSLE